MTNSQAYKLFMEIVALWSPKGTYEDAEKRAWLRVLQEIDYSQASTLITKLYEQRGEIDYDNPKKLLPAFKAEIKTDHKARPWCPCCDGTGFICFERPDGNSYVIPCHCKTGGLKDDDVCKNLLCQNPARASKKTFLAGYCEAFSWKVAGWRQCSYHPSITEVKHLHIPIVTKADRRVLNVLVKGQCQTKNLFDFPHKVQNLQDKIPLIGEIG